MKYKQQLGFVHELLLSSWKHKVFNESKYSYYITQYWENYDFYYKIIIMYSA